MKKLKHYIKHFALYLLLMIFVILSMQQIIGLFDAHIDGFAIPVADKFYSSATMENEFSDERVIVV